MFAHIFATRVKCIVRNRAALFWTLLFPILLGTMFYFAFSNIGKSENFQKFDVAVVKNDEFENDSAFKTALASVTDKSKKAGNADLFNVVTCDAGKADSLLKDSKVKGIIRFDNGPKLIVRESGLDQTILKEFLNDYLQTKEAVKTIAGNNPAALRSLSTVSQNRDYLHEAPLSKTKPDNMLCYYYALIAMACLYGGLLGMQEVDAIQANQSAQGARVNLAPVHKMKVFAYSLCAATAVQFLTVLVLVAYLHFVLSIDFGGKIPLVILACFAGCLTGVGFGAAVSAILKAKEVLKFALYFGASMAMCFLAGLMFQNMKYIVQVNAPALAVLNPANAVTDAFYSLYYYDTYTRYFENIALLGGFSAIFFLIVYFVLRRQRYESI